MPTILRVTCWGLDWLQVNIVSINVGYNTETYGNFTESRLHDRHLFYSVFFSTLLKHRFWENLNFPEMLPNSQYQKNRRTLVKLNKKPFFGQKIGLNCPLGSSQRVNTDSHIAYNRTIHPKFLAPQVLASGNLSFSVLPFRYPCFVCDVWGQ